MESANVDLVRSIYAAWERGDFSSVEWAHPEIEFTFAGGGPDDLRTWTGLAGMAEGFRSFVSVWQEFRVEAQEFRELDRERVLVLVRLSGRGRTSGMELDQMRAKGADIFHIRESKVTRLAIYPDRERALTELGLTPESGSLRS